MVDLSGLPNLAGPGSDDWLELNVDSGGVIKLDNVHQITSNTRFNVGLPSFTLPQATTLSSSTINLATNAGFYVPQLSSLTSSTMSASTGAVFEAASLAGITSSSINMSPGAVFQAPQLTSMDTVPLTLVGNAAFIATNLTTYKNSEIPIYPGRDFEVGVLTNIYGSWISVTGGTNFRVAAVGYELPGSSYYATCSPYYRAYPPKNLFSADGAGSLLDLSSLKSVQVYGAREGYDSGWRNDWTYFITAANQGVIDLSGLEIVYGADPNAYICDCAGNCGYYGQDDWLSFKVQTGGTILLPNLKPGDSTHALRDLGAGVPTPIPPKSG